MKNIFKVSIITLLSLFTTFTLVSCGSESLQNITGITFENNTVEFDGQEHKIEIKGTLPSGVEVSYDNNKAVEVGVYNATAKLSGEGYNSLELKAVLTITEAQGETITGISLTDKSVTYDGNKHVLEVSGTTTGFSISYENNEQVNAGTYNVVALVTKDGFVPLRLTATLTINKAVISGITFDGLTKVYDGESTTLLINGTLPSGVTVSYSNNTGTNAGTYNAVATISGANYETLVLNATLTINKAVITGIVFNDLKVTYDGNEHEIVVVGNLPVGTKVTYTSNKGTAQGTYNAVATITGSNYETLVLEAKLVITADIAAVALDLLKNITNTPDAWAFLPESFWLENRYDNFGAINQIDFTTSKNVSTINKGAIGLQMNVLYDTLIQNDKLLGYVNIVNLSLSSISIAYQNFINQNPNDYAEFSDNEGNFQYKIELDGNNILMLVQFAGNICLELEYDKDSETNTMRLQLSDTNALRLEASPSSLIISTNILNLLTSMLILNENEAGQNMGVLYEYTNVLATNLKTTSHIAVTEDYTMVTCNKREGSNIISIDAAVEVYDNVTGMYLGAEIKETVSSIKYDTYWLHLADVGINSIKINETITDGVAVANKPGDKLTNLIYLNNSSTAFKPKNVGGLTSTSFSRRFDIEYKTFFAYNYNSSNDSYDKVEFIVPMFFVQESQLTNLVDDMADVNGIAVNVTKNTAIINNYYVQLVDIYLEAKDTVEKEEILAFIGTKNDFFN